ncbi:hypothetical protein KRR40_43495 [Niabella defluvii]|nr:hypothetical protein KRR40_43495 [Niabella sp. I65]
MPAAPRMTPVKIHCPPVPLKASPNVPASIGGTRVPKTQDMPTDIA